jgi:hypothetical protein
LPALHDLAIAFVPLQSCPQPPQCSVLVDVLVSQPSSGDGAAGWLQLPRLAAQVDVQSPPLHASAAVPAVEHARPQAPQLAGSVPVLVSHPLSAVGAPGVVQLPNPATQVESHRPALHWARSTLAFEQGRPHAPQFAGSPCVSVSQPLSASGGAGVVQLLNPPLHVELHTPAEQLLTATLLSAHTRLQAPQLLTSDERPVSQPLSGAGAAGVEQLPKPELQVEVHRPALQAAVATFTVEQGRPQPPQ